METQFKFIPNVMGWEKNEGADRDLNPGPPNLYPGALSTGLSCAGIQIDQTFPSKIVSCPFLFRQYDI